jgi:rod shape-determining protein MreB
MLKGLDLLLRRATKLPILRSEDPFTAVVNGAGRALENLDLLPQGAIP